MPNDAGAVPLGLDLPAKASALATPFIGSTIMALPAQIEQPSPNKIESSAHSYDSSLREQALGHILLGQLLAFMWRNDGRDIEVLKGEVDRGGYDLVLESNGVIRHVQLKSSFRGSKVREVDVGMKLLRKP